MIISKNSSNTRTRQLAMKNLMTTTMAEGTPVRDHVLKMMAHLNEMEILGAKIDRGKPGRYHTLESS